jgi:hypothetical protein
VHLTDPATALKLFRAPVLHALDLHARGFELDHELTAHVLAAGHAIREVPVRYHPRTRREGKKIRARDWFLAVATYARIGRRAAAGSVGRMRPLDQDQSGRDARRQATAERP